MIVFIIMIGGVLIFRKVVVLVLFFFRENCRMVLWVFSWEVFLVVIFSGVGMGGRVVVVGLVVSSLMLRSMLLVSRGGG